ncbi:MAG: hypothetical protein ACXAC5_12505 [Promethearchaeota archaeon]|jgi:hypothetical protein
MCEFKIIKSNDGSQILEDIVILAYNENSELVLKDVIGMGETLESALILNVNTMNQKCVILENPIVKEFVSLITKISINQVNEIDFVNFINKLEEMKEALKS